MTDASQAQYRQLKKSRDWLLLFHLTLEESFWQSSVYPYFGLSESLAVADRVSILRNTGFAKVIFIGLVSLMFPKTLPNV